MEHNSVNNNSGIYVIEIDGDSFLYAGFFRVHPDKTFNGEVVLIKENKGLDMPVSGTFNGERLEFSLSHDGKNYTYSFDKKGKLWCGRKTVSGETSFSAVIGKLEKIADIF